jgi:hypothetical protein
MTAIDRLIDEIQHLPDAENRRALIGRYGEIRKRIEEAANRYRQSMLTLHTLSTLAPDDPQPDIATLREGLRKDVKYLRAFIEEDRVSGSSKRDEKLVTDIDDKTKLCLGTLTEAWNLYFRVRIEGYRPLANAAISAKLPGAARMQQTVGSLERLAGRLPESHDTGQAAAAAPEEIHNAIQHLGVQGRAGQFLIEATGAGASPDMSSDPEVRQFLETQAELRRLLKVKLA